MCCRRRFSAWASSTTERNEAKRPVTLKQNRAILHPMMLVSIAIWESGDAKSPRIARCRIARPAVISIAWFCTKRFLYCFSKECVPATHDSAKFVHRCLALRTPVLCCFDGWTPLFFSLHRSRSLFLRNPNNKIKKSVVEGILEETIGTIWFQDSRQAQSQLWQEQNGLAPGVFWHPIITSVSSENKLAGSKRNTRKHRRQSTRKKTSGHGYVPGHARSRITTSLTQNNSVTVLQTMRRNPSMQNRTILIQCDRALTDIRHRWIVQYLTFTRRCHIRSAPPTACAKLSSTSHCHATRGNDHSYRDDHFVHLDKPAVKLPSRTALPCCGML